MDKILSARIDEAVLHKINALAQKLQTTKKSVIENAIEAYAEKINKDEKIDYFEQTLGAWNREESTEETVKTLKDEFNQAQSRHQK